MSLHDRVNQFSLMIVPLQLGRLTILRQENCSGSGQPEGLKPGKGVVYGNLGPGNLLFFPLRRGGGSSRRRQPWGPRGRRAMVRKEEQPATMVGQRINVQTFGLTSNRRSQRRRSKFGRTLDMLEPLVGRPIRRSEVSIQDCGATTTVREENLCARLGSRKSDKIKGPREILIAQRPRNR